MPISHKVYSSRALNIDSNTYVGEEGRLFYAQTTATGIAPVLKYSDGVTPGGLPLSGSSLTFSSSTPPVNPHNGLLWWDSIGGRLYIYYDLNWVDVSPIPTLFPANSNGILYNNGTGTLSWIGIGSFQGPAGPAGPTGPAGPGAPSRRYAR